VLNPTTARALDLSQSVLRSISPIHLEYLANMGGAATMTISIVRQDQLWGLIACHHRTAWHVPARLRVVCELFAEIASLRLMAMVTEHDLEGQLAAKQTLETMMLGLAHEPYLSAGLTRLRPNLLDLIPSGAVTLWFDGRATHLGPTPRTEQIADLVDWLNSLPDGIFARDRLAGLYPPAAAFPGLASGLLALSLAKAPRDYVLWFLPEVKHSVTWAGDPDKPVQLDAHGATGEPARRLRCMAGGGCVAVTAVAAGGTGGGGGVAHRAAGGSAAADRSRGPRTERGAAPAGYADGRTGSSREEHARHDPGAGAPEQNRRAHAGRLSGHVRGAAARHEPGA
jgi:hypothetical protein